MHLQRHGVPIAYLWARTIRRARAAGLPRGAGRERGRAADAKRRRSAVERALTSQAAAAVWSTRSYSGSGTLAERLLGCLGAAPGVTRVEREGSEEGFVSSEPGGGLAAWIALSRDEAAERG